MNILSRTLVSVAAWMERKTDPTGNAVVAYVRGQVIRMGDSFAALSKEGYAKNAIVRSVIAKIAKSLAHTKVKLQRHDTDGKWIDLGGDEDDEHPLMMLMNKPNPMQSGYRFWSELITNYLLGGGCYMVGNGPTEDGPPTELWGMRPDRMEIIPGANNIPEAYVFNCNSQKVTFKVDANEGTSEVFEMRMYNPLDDWKLMSPLRAAALQVDQFNYAAEWNMANLQAGGRPQGGFTYKPAGNEMPFLDRNTRKKLERDIDQRMMGPRNARRPLVTDGGITWENYGLTAVEMDWLEGQRDAARTICLVYNVPPQLLGIPGDNTYSNYAEARMSFYEETVIPLLQELLDGLNSWLVPKFGEDLRLMVDLQSITALAPRRKEIFDMVNASTVHTLDERRKLLDLEEYNAEEAKKNPAKDIWMPSGLTPMQIASDPTAGMLDADGNPISEKDPIEGAEEEEGGDPLKDPNSGAEGGKPKKGGRSIGGGGKKPINGKKPAAPDSKFTALELSIKSMTERF